MTLRIFAALFAFAAALATALPAVHAADLDRPHGKVVLTVAGAITTTNGDGVARFDMAMLDALPQRVTATNTPWTKEKTRFSGPLVTALLDRVGAKGATLKITALNDYMVEVPVADFQKWPVILATRKDGERMSVRDKGPIFVIYPFDEDPSLYNEKYFTRSVWQVKTIEVH